MATQLRRSSRAAFVRCAPSLAQINERLWTAFGATGNFADLDDQPTGNRLPPSAGNELEAFAFSYFSSEWLSKLKVPDSSVDLKKAAWQRFWDGEFQCREANLRMYRWATGPFAREISLARNWIQRVLGPFSWDAVEPHFSFGPGASTRLPRRKADGSHKYSGTPECTSNCADLAESLIQFYPNWWLSASRGGRDSPIKVVGGNRVTTVPKNRKTDRMIAIEPDLNMYIQKGIGHVIRRKLKMVGCDLDDQRPNQYLAHSGSITDRFATIDLSMASDTICSELVEVLLPPDWHHALGMCRSSHGVLPSDQYAGNTYLYRKFSSMGNGYTFELESLIFRALIEGAARAMGEQAHEALVYGDDLIVPSHQAAHLLSVLSWVGFTPNQKKTHVYGSFRESCGKHYFRGHDVTPFYVKDFDRSLISLFKIHNQIWRLQNRWTWLGNDRRVALLSVCAWLRSYAPASWRRPTLIDGLGDGGFVGYFDEICPPVARKKKTKTWDGYEFTSFITSPNPSDNTSEGRLLLSLRQLERNVLPSDISWLEEGSYETIQTRVARGERIHVATLFVPRRFVDQQWTAAPVPC